MSNANKTRGRPPVDDPRTVRTCIRLTPGEALALDLEAERLATTASDLLRSRIPTSGPIDAMSLSPQISRRAS
jgi:hypothetical protein